MKIKKIRSQRKIHRRTSSGKFPPLGGWTPGVAFHRDDPICGAPIAQLTIGSLMGDSIYCEDPHCSARCGRIVVIRTDRFIYCAVPSELWLVDPEAGASILIDRDFGGGFAQGAYGDTIVYVTYSSGGRELVRLRLSTLERATVLRLPQAHAPFAGLGSLSPDGRYYVNLAGSTYKGEVRLLAVDLETGKETLITKDEDVINPHPRFDRMDGTYILVQRNRGQRWDKKNGFETFDKNLGATLFLARRDGTERRELPIARPYIPHGISGHEAWVTGQPEIVLSLDLRSGPYDDGKRKGNLVHYRLGDKKPSVLVHAPDKYYGHVSTSYCGKYWISDEWPVGCPRYMTPKIMIGSIKTGKYAALCQVGGNWCTYETGHAHPYMTADNRRIIFADSRTGIPQVFAAEIPKGFLENL